MLSIDDQISLLLWDRRIVNISDKIFYIHNISLPLRNKAISLKDRVYKQAIKEGVSSDEELVKDAISAGILTPEYEKELADINVQVKDLTDNGLKNKSIVKRKKAQSELKRLQAALHKINDSRNKLYVNSADYLANEAYIYCLMHECVFDENDCKLWKDETDLYNMRRDDPKLFSELINEFVSGNISDTKTIRQIARSYEWRLQWNLCKEDLSQIFCCPVSSFNLNQKALIYWSRVYDSVYEDANKPSEDVIQDDDLLDDWLLERHNSDPKAQHKQKNDQEQMIVLDGYYSETCVCGVASMKIKGHGERPKHTNNCAYGTWVKYTQEEKDRMAESFYGKNASNVRAILNNEHDIVAQKGVIEEQHLRKGKTRHLLGMEQKQVKK